MLDEIVRNVLIEDCGLLEGEILLVAVSGGADSLGLLKVLKDLNLRIIMAHFDHHLRENSSQEAAVLQKLAEEWGVPIIIGEEDVNAFARKERMGVEEAARQCRYHFLFEAAKVKGARAVVTAHHADDQVETILMHFLRGAGFNGLEGMRPVSYLKQYSKDIPIWRPLLDVPKDEILRYCEEQGLVFFNDETNADLTYFRNSLRHKLLPEIESIAPSFRQTILRNARAIQKDNDLLRVDSHSPGDIIDPQIRVDAISFNRQNFMAKLPGRQTSQLKEAIMAMESNLRDIGYEKLIELVEKVKMGTRRTDIGRGLVMQIAEDAVSILRQSGPVWGFPQVEGELTLEFDKLPQRVTLRDGFVILVEKLPWDKYENLPESTKNSPMHAFLSWKNAFPPLTIHATQAGLRWQPLGLIEGSQKLSDSMINAKIPRAARAKYPLVMMKNEIAWVPGLRISQAFRLIEKEPQVLHLELLQGD